MLRAISLCLVVVIAACGTARRGPPADDPLQLTAATERGEAVFMTYCNQCHPRGEAGLAFAINNKPLPRSLIRFQVRNGLGVMPAFPEDIISEPEMDDLLEYIDDLRDS